MAVVGAEGAVPLQKLIELDSQAHHIRDDLDRERVESAQRNQTLREQIGAVDTVVRQHGEQLAGIRGAVTSVKWMIATIIPAAVGAAYALGHLIR